MEYTRLGTTDITIPRLCIGGMSFGKVFPDFHQWVIDQEATQAVIARALELGVNFIDTANVYAHGTSEEFIGASLKNLGVKRENVVLASKVYFNEGHLSRAAIEREIDGTLERLGTDYLDLYIIHRFDYATPIEETMTALDQAVRSGRALYVGISSYSATRTKEAARIARELGTPLLIHQPSYNMLNRWIESDLIDACESEGMGIIAFTALAQGLLTDRYLSGVPEDSRAARGGSLTREQLSDDVLTHVRALHEIARERGQSLAQMALAWVLRDPRVTSTLIGVSSLRQLESNLGALENMVFTDDELAAIDEHAVESGINLWASQTED